MLLRRSSRWPLRPWSQRPDRGPRALARYCGSWRSRSPASASKSLTTFTTTELFERSRRCETTRSLAYGATTAHAIGCVACKPCGSDALPESVVATLRHLAETDLNANVRAQARSALTREHRDLNMGLGQHRRGENRLSRGEERPAVVASRLGGRPRSTLSRISRRRPFEGGLAFPTRAIAPGRVRPTWRHPARLDPAVR